MILAGNSVNLFLRQFISKQPTLYFVLRFTQGTTLIPVILDTDIGFDVDDVWALAFMLKCPELDVKLITTNTGDTHYSACIVAKLLEISGRQDIPIGIGIPIDNVPRTHAKWLGDFQLESYQGQVLLDGVGAICQVIGQS